MKQTKLYTELAYFYDAMYQTFIDYDEEYRLYKNLMNKYEAHTVLEIGCGSGHLAKRFNTVDVGNPANGGKGYDYEGFDLSENMLNIARKRVPEGKFFQGNMTELNRNKNYDAILITARTLSYLVENQDIINAFKSIHKHLNPKGVLIFDFIDAYSFFKNMDETKIITHHASLDGKDFKRESQYKKNLSNGWTWDWHSIFFEKKENDFSEIARDTATLRAFLKQEIQLFLELTDYEIKDVIEQKTYAFDTFIFTASKKM